MSSWTCPRIFRTLEDSVAGEGLSSKFSVVSMMFTMDNRMMEVANTSANRQRV